MICGDWARATPEGVVLLVRVIPRAGATRIAGIRDGRLLVRLAAPPVDNAANDALVAFLAKRLDVPARNIALTGGAQSRNKQMSVAGVSIEHALALAADL